MAAYKIKHIRTWEHTTTTFSVAIVTNQIISLQISLVSKNILNLTIFRSDRQTWRCEPVFTDAIFESWPGKS